MYIPSDDLVHPVWMVRYTKPPSIVGIAFWKNWWDCDDTSDTAKNLVIMQYTWFKDNQWKEIYEGDIVDNVINGVSVFRTVVKYMNWYYSPFVAFPEYRCWYTDKTKVIWNIFEKPELLEATLETPAIW
jgi:hypothetical protein